MFRVPTPFTATKNRVGSDDATRGSYLTGNAILVKTEHTHTGREREKEPESGLKCASLVLFCMLWPR
jgi:hypothetical protein